LHDVDDILRYIVKNGRFLFRSDFMGLALLDSEAHQFELRCFATATETSMVNAAIHIDNRLVLHNLRHNAPYRSAQDEPAASFAGYPLATWSGKSAWPWCVSN
jgi:hypothetical protein